MYNSFLTLHTHLNFFLKEKRYFLLHHDPG